MILRHVVPTFDVLPKSGNAPSHPRYYPCFCSSSFEGKFFEPFSPFAYSVTWLTIPRIANERIGIPNLMNLCALDKQTAVKFTAPCTMSWCNPFGDCIFSAGRWDVYTRAERSEFRKQCPRFLYYTISLNVPK